MNPVPPVMLPASQNPPYTRVRKSETSSLTDRPILQLPVTYKRRPEYAALIRQQTTRLLPTYRNLPAPHASITPLVCSCARA